MKAAPGVRGFSLIEVAIVLAIASIVLLSLVGLTGTALNTTKESSMNLEAASVAAQLVTQWGAMVEWNSDPNALPKTTQPAGFPLAVDPPTKGVEQKGEGILIDKSGMVTSTPSEQAFNLKYSVLRSSDNPSAVRLYLRLSWPPTAAGNASEARSHYELVAGVLLKKDS